jgi:phosphohistidine swiveling domain-containing protein
MWNFAKKAERDYPLLQAEVKKYSLAPSKDLQPDQLLELIERLKELNLWATTNSFLSIILMQIYCGILDAQLKKLDVDFAQFDLTQGMDELDSYDPNIRLEALNQRYLELDEQVRSQIELADWQIFQNLDGIEDFRKEVEIFLTDFGHMSDRTVMFDTVPWRETPSLILDLIVNFKKPRESSHKKVSYSQIPQRGFAGMMIKTFYKRARQFRLFRERYSSLYTYSLMLFRIYYLAIADRLLDNGILSAREDIYYLHDQEIQDYMHGKNNGDEFRTLIQQRMEEMQHCKDALAPEVIYGDSPPPVVIRPDRKLSGTPTSRGYYTGKTKVVRGITDFHKVSHGDVLVIPYSEVGWIPLFAKAGAVVAESGGMLSHSSIVAREYGIPAVVSVNGALQLQDDLVVSIDGYRGEVFVHGVD